MPTFVAALLGGLVQIAGTLAGRVLLALGFGAITYTGVSASLSFLKTQAISAAGGLGAEALQLMAYMKVGECISILSSAYLVSLTLAGLSAGGSISRLVKTS
jgi:hypothetical protein